MAKNFNLADLEVGQQVASRVYEFDRGTLVRYAGASGDFNPIHFNDPIAKQVGLDGVLAHGMLTMGAAVQPIVDWIGDPTRVANYQVRFTRPVWVPEIGGSVLKVSAKIQKLDPEQRIAVVMIDAVFDGKAVLGKALATVTFA